MRIFLTIILLLKKISHFDLIILLADIFPKHLNLPINLLHLLFFEIVVQKYYNNIELLILPIY